MRKVFVAGIGGGIVVAVIVVEDCVEIDDRSIICFKTFEILSLAIEPRSALSCPGVQYSYT